MAEKYYTAPNAIKSNGKNSREKKSYYLENDESAIANMPQNARIAKYPDGVFMDQDYGCSIEDIDAKKYSDVRKMSKHYVQRKGG